MLANAAEMFGSKSVSEISKIIEETLEGHQRAIMGNMTVEEIYRDRKTFSQKVVFFHLSAKLNTLYIHKLHI